MKTDSQTDNTGIWTMTQKTEMPLYDLTEFQKGIDDYLMWGRIEERYVHNEKLSELFEEKLKRMKDEQI